MENSLHAILIFLAAAVLVVILCRQFKLPAMPGYLLVGLLIGPHGMALIAELSSPGVGVGGFVSFLCFLLYFWSNYMNGTADVLEVMLFLAGLVCLLLELLVLPGDSYHVAASDADQCAQATRDFIRRRAPTAA